MWSIHAFIRQNDSTKQVPLLFVLMSRRCKDDYCSILNYLKEKLPEMSLDAVVMDFEAAVWGAVRSFFPATTLRGCSFHWGQAVWRRIQDDGLGPTYRRKKKIFKFLREILCLPFLPAEQMPATLKDFRDLLLPTQPEQLDKFMQYMEDKIDTSPKTGASLDMPLEQITGCNNKKCDQQIV